jgi:hypothetical protein
MWEVWCFHRLDDVRSAIGVVLVAWVLLILCLLYCPEDKQLLVYSLAMQVTRGVGWLLLALLRIQNAPAGLNPFDGIVFLLLFLVVLGLAVGDTIGAP